MESLIKGEVRGLLAGRIRWEHVAAFEILSEPFRCARCAVTIAMVVSHGGGDHWQLV